MGIPIAYAVIYFKGGVSTELFPISQWNEWKPTKSRLSLAHHAYKSSRWAE